MQKHDYIDAVISLLNEGRDFESVINKLKNVLEKRGHQKLYKTVLAGLLKKIEDAVSTKVPVVTFAREKDVEQFKASITKHLAEIESTQYETEFDSTLIGGFVIEHNNKIIDNSYKSRLVSLYRSLIG